MGGTPGAPPVPTSSAATPTPGPDGLGKASPSLPVQLKGKDAVFEVMAENSAVKALSDLATDAKFDRNELTITVARESILAAGEAVLQASYNFLEDVTAVDWYPSEPRFQITYHILSMSLKERLRLVVRLDSGDAAVDSITP